MVDISAKTRTAADIFRHVLDAGPLTLYAASSDTRFPLGTIHRHFKEMESAGKIRVYHQNAGGRRKKMYGPTFYGMVYFARLDREVWKKIENYFLLWIGNLEFCRVLEQEGFDIGSVRKDRGRGKVLFRRYIEYGMEVENQIEVLKTDSSAVSRETLVLIGEILLNTDPKFRERWRYLYRNLPGLQRAVDENIESLIAMQRQLKN